jgi:protein-S-isoprenylcysteine O-methyltransferase Ste14
MTQGIASAEGRNFVYVGFIVQVVAVVVWLAAEAYLIWRDSARGKGTTDIDRRTRNYNTAATVLCLILGLAVNWIGFLRFASLGASEVLWIGSAVMLLGFILRHWSIIVLGRYFRTTIELEKDQKVIDRGPYRYIRHPSYSGIILFFIGYGLVSKNWLSLIVIACLPTISLIYRIEFEELALVKGLGSEYIIYQKVTKKLIPGVW